MEYRRNVSHYRKRTISGGCVIVMTEHYFNVDEKVVEHLKRKIIIQENRNLKTGEKTDSQMITWIKNKIEEEAK